MAQRNILIVGAGIGGLAAGCYAQMNGYATRILEMHNVPGGVCTSWSRDGYVFDGCIHNLAGTNEKSHFHQIWRELGVVPAIEMVAHEELVRVERPDGEPFVVYTDLDRLLEHMGRLFPEDSDTIKGFIAVARSFRRVDFLGLAAAPARERLHAFGLLPAMLQHGRFTLANYAKRFNDPFLRHAFPKLVYDWPDQQVMVLLAFLAATSQGDLGWPKGGSKALARAIERRFTELGGQIHYGKRVTKILVESDRAVGVRLADGTEERADIVISNANGFTAIFDMLSGHYSSRSIRAFYRAPEDRIEMGIHVSLGAARDLSQEPHAIVLPLEQPVAIAGERRDRLYVEPFGFDPSLAPPGKGVLKVVMATSFRLWEDLCKEPERYAAAKHAVADTVISLLETRFPGLQQQIEVVDVATPMTTLRFTGNGHGYHFPMSSLALGVLTGRRLSARLPGLANFHMVGQWAGLPGVSVVAAMGRDVIRHICREGGRAFGTR